MVINQKVYIKNSCHRLNWNRSTSKIFLKRPGQHTVWWVATWIIATVRPVPNTIIKKRESSRGWLVRPQIEIRNWAQNDWKYQATINGHCLTFNPSQNNVSKTLGKRPRLSMTFAQNESDSTFGWNGALQGFNVHYRYPTEKLFLPGHSVFLSSKLVKI